MNNMTKHFERGLNSKGELVKFKNIDIDPLRSHLNYNLAPVREEGQIGYIGKMVGVDGKQGEAYCMKRADVNVMASWVVTLPKDFPLERSREFFEQTYQFLKNRYDPTEKNVVSAYVHMDETTPHMHYGFIPIVNDKKHGLKVRASAVITRMDLQKFHDDLQNTLENHFGFKVEIQNDATKDGNRSIEELKRGSAIERLSQVEKTLLNANNELREVSESIGLTRKNLELEKEKLNLYKKQTLLLADSSQISMKRPEYVEVLTEKQGSLFKKQEIEFAKVPLEKWDEKHVAQNRISLFERKMDEYEKNIENTFEKASESIKTLQAVQKELFKANNIISAVSQFFNSNHEAKEQYLEFEKSFKSKRQTKKQNQREEFER